MSHLESGSVVWVRLGQAWWPGTITTVAKCPPEFVEGIRKMPIAIVKFFHENEFQDVHKSEHICPYNCDRKEEFIRRGQYTNKNQSHGEVDLLAKFEADVVTAEKLTGGDMNILQTLDEVAGKRRIDYSDLGFGAPKPKKRKDVVIKIGSDIGQAVVYKKVGSRNIGNKLQRVVIEHKVRILEQPKRKNVEEDMRGAANWFKCYTCGFTCSRLNVIVWHNKAHIKKVFNYDTGIKIPGRRKRKQGTPKSNKEIKKKAKEAKSKDNMDHAHTNGEVIGSKKDVQDTQQLLMDWVDDDEGIDGEAFTTLPSGLDKDKKRNESDDGYSDTDDYPPLQPKYERRPMPKPAELNSAFDALLAATPANPITPSSSQTSNYVNNDSDSDYSDWEKYYARDSGSGSEDEEVEQESDIKSLCEGKEGKAETGHDTNAQMKPEEKDDGERQTTQEECLYEARQEGYLESTPSPKIDCSENVKSQLLSEIHTEEKLTLESKEDGEKEGSQNTVHEPEGSIIESADITGPVGNMDEPIEIISETDDDTDKPIEDTNKPAEDNNEPTEVTCKSIEDTGKPVKHHYEPPEHIDEPIKHHYEPHEHIYKPDKHHYGPPEHIDEPEKHHYEPPEHIDKPDKHLYEPPEPIDEPVKHHYEPPKHTSEPVEHYEPPEHIGKLGKHQYKPPEHSDEPDEHHYEPPEHIGKLVKQYYEPPEHIGEPDEHHYEPPEHIGQPVKHHYEPIEHYESPEHIGEPVEKPYEPPEHVVEPVEEPYEPPEPIGEPVEPYEPPEPIEEPYEQPELDEDHYEPPEHIDEPIEDHYEPPEHSEPGEDHFEPPEHSEPVGDHYEPPEPTDEPAEGCEEPGKVNYELSKDTDEQNDFTEPTEDIEESDDCTYDIEDHIEEPEDSGESTSHFHKPAVDSNESTRDIDELTENIDRLNQNITEFTQAVSAKLGDNDEATKDVRETIKRRGSTHERTERTFETTSNVSVHSHTKIESASEGGSEPIKTSEVATTSSSGMTYMLVAVDAHGNTVPTVPTPAISEGGNDLVAVEAAMEDGTTRTLYIDPSQLGPNVDLNNLMLHIDSSGQEHVIIPSSSSSDSETTCQELHLTETSGLHQNVTEVSDVRAPYSSETHGYHQIDYEETVHTDHYTSAQPDEGESL